MVEGHVAGFFMLVIMVGSFFYSKYLAGSGRTPKMQTSRVSKWSKKP